MEIQNEINSILKLFHSKKLEEAKLEIYKVLKKSGDSEVLYNLLGAIFAEENKLEEAIINYNKSIKINSNYAQAYNNLGVALHKLNKLSESIDKYKKALSLKNDFPEALNNIASVMREINKPKEALVHLTNALKIKKNYAEAYNNLGLVYQDLGEKKTAIENFKKAIEIKPDYAEVYNSLGMIYSDLVMFEESLSNYNKAINLKNYYEKAYNNLGNLFSHTGKYDKATEAYYKAISIKPDYAKAYSNLLFNFNYKNDFDPNLYLSEAKKFRKNCKSNLIKRSTDYKYDKNPSKLKLGLVSADFGNHPGGFFTLSTLRELRKKNFELIAYSTTDRKDELSSYFRPLFKKWNLVEKKSDQEIVDQIILDGINILVDLQGHSAGNRLPIFIYKPAPVQVSWLGQGSTGIHEIDYFVGSHHINPHEEDKNYVEKIYRLPEISQCFTQPTFDVEVKALPALKNNFITFGSFNKLAKTNEEVISLWSKVLLAIPNSKILLKNKDFENRKTFEDTMINFENNNINKNRVILSGESKTRKELLETYNKIDIGLDPFPFQGNTTTCEAIWMGVPVITLKGNRYLFHFGESINSNINMKEWIVDNQEDYISCAIKHSKDLKKLSEIRKNLRKVALESPVFNEQNFSNHLSKMFWEMWNNFQKN